MIEENNNLETVIVGDNNNMVEENNNNLKNVDTTDNDNELNTISKINNRYYMRHKKETLVNKLVK